MLGIIGQMTKTKNREFNKLTKKEQEQMKSKYLSYVPVAKIAREHNVSRTTVQYHANTHWSKLRESNKAELFSQFEDTRRETFVKMTQSAQTIVARALEDLAKREMPPTPREAQQITSILETLDKISRLDAGDPTEIRADKPVSIKQIKEKLALDPFDNIETIEFEEKENASETSDKK